MALNVLRSILTRAVFRHKPQTSLCVCEYTDQSLDWLDVYNLADTVYDVRFTERREGQGRLPAVCVHVSRSAGN
jgi:hypothetical protein